MPYPRLQELAPSRRDEEQYTVQGPLQRGSTDQHDKEDHVGEEGGEVGGLTGALDALGQHHEQHYPGEEEAQGELPLGGVQTVGQAVRILLQHLIPVDVKQN